MRDADDKNDTILVRDVETLEVQARADIPSGWRFWQLAFTPDEQFLLVGASKLPNQRPPWRDHQIYAVLVFDARSGEQVRTLDIPRAVYGLAASPENRFVASADKIEKRRNGLRYRRAILSLYDFESGEEVARGEFPWERAPESRPLQAMGAGEVQKIFFTPDGSRLIASTYEHTRIWDLPEGLPRHADGELSAVHAPSVLEEPPAEGDRCHAYVVDMEAAREFARMYLGGTGEEWLQRPDDEKKVLAAAVEKDFDEFHPDFDTEERLTTKTYPFPFGGKGVFLTASVVYSDDRMTAKVGDLADVLESMALCVWVGDQPAENACEVPGNAIAESAYTRFSVKSRVITRAEIAGRMYTVGLECERQAGLEALLGGAEPGP